MKILKNPGFYFALVLALILGLTGYVLYTVNVLTLPLFALVIAILVILFFISAILMIKKGLITRIIGWILAIALALTGCLSTYLLYTAYDTLKTISTNPEGVMSVASCYVLRTGVITDIEGLDGRKIGYLRDINEEGTSGVISGLKDAGISFETVEYDSSLKMVKDLKGAKEIDAIILNQSYLAVIADYDGQEKIADELVSVFDYEYESKKTNESDSVNVTNTPFTVLISGIDTYGSISETSRSDVNLLVSVNPNTHEVLMISIPRDYYVETACEAEQGCAVGEMDKLTHTGLHGIMTTEMTLEKLLDTQINYNVRVNFSTLVNLVDELGGITVNNPNEFTSGGYTFHTGDIELDGEQALAFARERYSFLAGDRERGRNQMRVLEGIIDKMISPAILNNFSSILKTVQDSFQTNMSVDDMTDLVKMQLSSGKGWTFYTYSLDGSDDHQYAYELGDVAYVMNPNEETVSHAKDDLQAMANGETPPYKNS